jgi:hypothetical protein
VGVLLDSTESDPGIKRLWEALLDGLHEKGWEDGRNLILEARYAGADTTRFPALARDARRTVAVSANTFRFMCSPLTNQLSTVKSGNYSSSSSARASSEAGTVRPSAFAVFRLTCIS